MITQNSRILITGCGGMLGEAFYLFYSSICSVKATDIDINENWLSCLDVRDYKAIDKEIVDFKPTIVFHLAAFTDLEYCELHQTETYDTNAMGTENIALLCKKHNIPLMYISTAGIFDGEKDEYNDFDQPNPINCYGKSKYAGELFVKTYLDKFFVFRAGWMMGGGPKKDKKFIKKIIDKINSGKKELFVVKDKLGTPTYTHDFAKTSMEVINSGLYGVYNMVCDEDGSRYDVAKELLKILNLENKIKLTEVSSDYFKKEYFVPRPYSEKLVTLKLKIRNLSKMRGWKECLSEYLRSYNWLKKENI